MKKLLTLLGSVTLITTTSVAVIACGGTRSEQKTTDTEKKDDKEKSKEEKEEFKSVLSDEVKKEASKIVTKILTDGLDLSDNSEDAVLKNKESISTEFANILDEILIENKNDVEKSLQDFKDKLVKFTAPFFIGDLLGQFPELEDGGSLWISEVDIDSKKEDIIGIVFNEKSDQDLVEESKKLIENSNEEDEKTIKEIIKDYKKDIDDYKKLFEEENKESLSKLKELLEKHFPKVLEAK
ncbi:lipoprotein [Mycoplasma capricolum subsp. capricolum]|uniref:lipoprotein n=1 Tax=Mycoplasma capricolum TaxID=2095 RepID=UPI003DA5DDC2